MRISKMWITTLLAALTATTVLLAGCSGGGVDQTTGQVNQGNTVSAAAAPTLGTDQSFAVLGGQTVTNTGPSVITGDLGVSPGSAVTGFPPGIVAGGTIHTADAVALNAQSDTTIAYDNLAGQACTSDVTGQDLGGKTLVPGVYCSSSSAQLTGTLTLNAGGDPNAVWVFKTVSTLTTASNSSVLITNGGQPCNVFWQVGSSAVLGTTTSFVGNILALTSIALQTGASVSGRALARNGAVTLDSNTVSAAVCGVPPVTPIPPTLSKAFSPVTIDAGGVSTLTITLSNANATPASLTAQFIDTLPSGLLVIGSSVSSTCIESLTGLAAGISRSPAWFVIGPSAVGLMEGAIPANGSCTVTAQVTAPVAGNFLNSLPAGALQTSNGNNAAPAVATLTVNTVNTTGVVTAPTLGKTFSPMSINAGGVSTLTITLSNANATPASLTAQFIDTLPS
ncbi:MAG TPA: ice-binding family protein, partial [Burkholderiales bacterium]